MMTDNRYEESVGFIILYKKKKRQAKTLSSTLQAEEVLTCL